MPRRLSPGGDAAARPRPATPARAGRPQADDGPRAAGPSGDLKGEARAGQGQIGQQYVAAGTRRRKEDGDYTLKLNSYDLGVDIELADAVQRLRFEHPDVRCVVLTGGLGEGQPFCSGANIRMLGSAGHPFKVNFCKLTNETRLAMEDAAAYSGQRYLAALNGTASGGGYELALACGHILLVDDRNSAVSLPEVPLLGVLPGTGGLTRVTDKRRVRRDRADWFATRAEGLRGAEALDWGLVDELAPRVRLGRGRRGPGPWRWPPCPIGPMSVPPVWSCARSTGGSHADTATGTAPVWSSWSTPSTWAEVRSGRRRAGRVPARPPPRPRRGDPDAWTCVLAAGPRRASWTTCSASPRSTSPRWPRCCCARSGTARPGGRLGRVPGGACRPLAGAGDHGCSGNGRCSASTSRRGR